MRMRTYWQPYPAGSRYSPDYLKHDTTKIILHLHKIEKKLRDEIKRDQVKVWTKAEIKARYG